MRLHLLGPAPSPAYPRVVARCDRCGFALWPSHARDEESRSMTVGEDFDYTSDPEIWIRSEQRCSALREGDA